MNSKKVFIFLALILSLFFSANHADAANICNKNKKCDFNRGENKSNCPSDCKNVVHPQLKFIQSDITAYNGDIAKMNDFAEASIKFSVKAVNGDIYIPNNPELFCNATGTKNISILLAETPYDAKNKIYVVPKNLTKKFECKVFMMPEVAGKYYAYMPSFVWGKTAKTAIQNKWDKKNYLFLSDYSTYSMELRQGTDAMISGFHLIRLRDKILDLEKSMEKEKKSSSRKLFNKLKLEKNYLEKAILEFGVKQEQ